MATHDHDSVKTAFLPPLQKHVSVAPPGPARDLLFPEMETMGDNGMDVDDESVVELIFHIKAEWMQQRPELCDVIENFAWQTMKQTMEVCFVAPPS